METKRLGLVCVVLLVSQLLLTECNAQDEGKTEKKGKGNSRGGGENQKGGKKEENKQSGPPQSEKGQKSKGGKGSSPQGKFTTKDKSECTWAVSEADTVSLRVECLKGGDSYWCEFAGTPSSCPQYAANQKNYWKQIARALKKQKNLCQDPKAVLKSKECKKGPKEAHLSLLSSSLAEAAPGEQKKNNSGKKSPHPSPTTAEVNPDAGTSSKECVEDVEGVDQKKVAEEYCGESWSSLCTFFFSMLQNKKC
ncbi:hypothetical protein NDU88_001892 [Pleurodeles waltl]|uniref:Fibroblast growth factor-binding protein 1 n=1 Tax=Pleurodeles waltl TaxID=8319 RepID=A0AAV7WP30_PLEWA|nr:hypothetical protein NDU88_001892 [Pleurodeles waltl]